MANKLIVRTSPHILSPNTSQRIMLDVIIALMPALIAACYLFGLRTLLLVSISIISCLFFEYLFRRITKRSNTLCDLSAVVTGLLIALNVPIDLPLYIIVFGAFVAIVVTKQLFGGLGQNFANPAITARIAMVVSFAAPMSSFLMPSGRAFMVDAVSSATPLALMKNADFSKIPNLFSLFFGVHGGSIGETCAFALILGGIYLIIRKVISIRIPLAYIGTVAIFAWLAGQNPLQHVLTGGLLLGAIFMATDYSTSPATKWGRIFFGAGCGFITMAIRLFGSFPEGVSFAILFMNIFTPHLERITRTKVFGGVKS